MKKLHLILALLALALTATVATSALVPALLLLTFVACLLNRPQGRLCTVSLSVPEILKDVLDAFKLETPELFQPGGFARNFKSDTAVLGDRVTARISHVPVIGSYDPTRGVGFYSGAQDAASLIEDIPIWLNHLQHCPVKSGWLTSIATKGVPLYKAAISQVGWALGKFVVDSVLSQAAVSVSNATHLTPGLCNVDTWDGQCRAIGNALKWKTDTRWALISTALADSLGADDRTRSSLIYGQLNGKQRYRRWTDLGGFRWIREYDDIRNSGTNITGLMGDDRLACVSVRKIRDMENAADQLGVPKVMEFYPLKDEESGLELTGISWQEAGTGDLYVTAAILFGTHVGNGGQPAGSVTDNAGCLIYTP